MKYRIVLLIVVNLLITGCASNILTGASLIYDRHNVYIKVNDFNLGAQINRALYQDNLFKCPNCAIEVAVFNRDILMVGQVPTQILRDEAYARVNAVPGKRRLFNQLDINQQRDDAVLDSWITAKIRSQIIANSDIDPSKFKVVTYGRIVYLMGDVVPEQASQVILYARQCASVKRVVKLFKYYNLSNSPSVK